MTSNPNSKRTESPAAFETFRRFSHAYYAIANQVLGSVGATTDHVTSYTPLIHSFPCTHATKRSTECRTQLVSNDFYKTIALQNEQKNHLRVCSRLLVQLDPLSFQRMILSYAL